MYSFRLFQIRLSIFFYFLLSSGTNRRRTKKFAEADQVLRAAAKLKGASAEIYWNIADGKEISESACRKISQLLANQTLMF